MRSHRDSIKEFFKTLIDKAKELAQKFKSLGVGRSIVVILARIAQVASACLTYYGAKDYQQVKETIPKLIKLREQISKVGWDYVNADIGNSGLLGRKHKEYVSKILWPSLKFVGGLLGAIVSEITVRLAKRTDSAFRRDGIDQILQKLEAKAKQFSQMRIGSQLTIVILRLRQIIHVYRAANKSVEIIKCYNALNKLRNYLGVLKRSGLENTEDYYAVKNGADAAAMGVVWFTIKSIINTLLAIIDQIMISAIKKREQKLIEEQELKRQKHKQKAS